MMAVRTWSLPHEPQPAPPRTAAQLLRAAGLVDPLLAALLPAALEGDRSVRAAQGGFWQVTTWTEGSTRVVVAMDATEGVAAQRVLEALPGALEASDIVGLLVALPDPLRLVVDGQVVAPRPGRLDGMEAEVVAAALSTGVAVSDEGWGAATLRVEGRAVGVLLGLAEDRAQRVLLGAWATALAAPVARLLERPVAPPVALRAVFGAVRSRVAADLERLGACLEVEGAWQARVVTPSEPLVPLLEALVRLRLEPRATVTLWAGEEGPDVLIEVVGGACDVPAGVRDGLDGLGLRQEHGPDGSRLRLPRARP